MEHTPREAAVIEMEKGAIVGGSWAAGVLFLELGLIFSSYCTTSLGDHDAISVLRSIKSYVCMRVC